MRALVDPQGSERNLGCGRAEYRTGAIAGLSAATADDAPIANRRFDAPSRAASTTGCSRIGRRSTSQPGTSPQPLVRGTSNEPENPCSEASFSQNRQQVRIDWAVTAQSLPKLDPHRPKKNPAFAGLSQIGAPGFEPGTSPTRTVRATRLRHAPLHSVCRKRCPGAHWPGTSPPTVDTVLFTVFEAALVTFDAPWLTFDTVLLTVFVAALVAFDAV
jgi:hypothetical protein